MERVWGGLEEDIQKGERVNRIVLVMLLFLTSAHSVFAQEAYQHFFGEIGEFNSSTVKARVGIQEYVTIAQDGKYGYDPAFKVLGTEGGFIRFFVGSTFVKEIRLTGGEITRFDLQPSPVFESDFKMQPSNSEIRVQVREEYTGTFKKTMLITTAATFLVFFLLLIVTMCIRNAKAKLPLAEYIQARLQRGDDEIEIIRSLEQEGWPRQTVGSVMTSVKNEVT